MLNKIKKFKFIMIAEIVALFLLILFISPRKAFSELIPGNYTVSEERYLVTMERYLYNVSIYWFSSYVGENFTSYVYADYVDADGNSFDFSTLSEGIEYSCYHYSGKCTMGYNEASDKMFNKKLGYVETFHGDYADEPEKSVKARVVMPKSFTYNSTTYYLDSYYASYGCQSSTYWGKVNNVIFNGENYAFNKYSIYPYTQFFTDKIKVGDTEDSLIFNTEHYDRALNINIDNQTKLANFSSIRTRFWSYDPIWHGGKYENGAPTDYYSRLYHYPSNYHAAISFLMWGENFKVTISDTKGLAYDKFEVVKWDDEEKLMEFLANDYDHYVTVLIEDLPPPVVINNNTSVESGGDKEFGYTITLSEKINGNHFGIDYVDGVGKIKIKAGESGKVYVPYPDLDFTITLDEYEWFKPEVKEFTGTASMVVNNVIDTNYIEIPKPVKPLIINNNTSVADGKDNVFSYTITLGQPLNDVYSGVEFVDGVAEINLKAGESISISIPVNNLYYTIKPKTYRKYISSSNVYAGYTSNAIDTIINTLYTYNTEYDNYYFGTVVSLEDLVPGRSYVVFRVTGGVGYMLTGKGNAKEITSYSDYRGGKVKWPNSGEAYSNVLWTYSGTPDKALFESFGAVNTYLTVGKSTSGKRPVGNEVSYVKLVTSSSPAMKVSNGGYYLALNSTKDKYSSSTSGSSLYFAEIDEDIHKVKFYGTNEGLHIYEGAVDKEYSVISGAEIVAPGTDSIKSPEKYNYVLDSWIDLSSKEVVKPGDTIEIDKDRVFYANWVPKTYDIGVNTDTVSTVDTNDFIKTEIFDYNELFNLHSSTYNNNRWSLASKGNTSHTGTSLGLVFFDNAKNSKAGLLNSVDGRDKSNGSRQVENGPSYYDGIVTQGIGNDIISHLFDKAETDLGVNYVGEGNHLYQYDEKTGFYYYDSRKNAASYNASKQRFYVYNYKYGTSKSMAEGENGADFLPFNYMKKSDALNGKSVSSSNGATNYWFGLKSEIDFYLTDDVGRVDSDGEYGNKALNGNDMILKFSGDDDVWIFVDDKLVLDLGGSHDIVYGEINFSTGVVTVAHNGAIINTDAVGGIGFSQNEVADNTKIIQTKLSGIKAGEHKATFYYVERGASRSNVSLYFNINDKLDEPGTIVVTRDEESYESFEKHEFTLKLNNTTINGQYGELMFKDGEAKFKLLGGESIKAIGLPAGIKYTLKVFAPVKHTTEFNGVVYESREINGRVVGGNTSEVQYKNLYDEYSEDNNDVIIPDTKDNIFNYLVILITSIFTCVVAVVIYFRINKKQNVVEEIEILSEY